MPFSLTKNNQHKKKPPPRPPPPNFNKLKSKSTHNINNKFESLNLIDWSPPSSPRTNPTSAFGGSVSSSFSSSTSSLASSKKSTDIGGFTTPPFTNNFWNGTQTPTTQLFTPTPNNNTATNWYATFTSNGTLKPIENNNTSNNISTNTLLGPTIIRPQNKKKPRPDILESLDDLDRDSPPMPTVPPPSPPKNAGDVITPYGIALFPFPATVAGDLALEVNDVVILIRRVNVEWLYGQVEDREGIFPENFIQIMVPLPGESLN